MCIAIVKPAGSVISDDRLRECFKTHDDGAGFAYVRKGNVVISKGHMTFDDFYKAYTKQLERNPNSNFLIHFRTSTSGVTDKENTHPFPIPKGAMIHNGVLFRPTENSNRSDTHIVSTVIGKFLKCRADWVEKMTELEELIGWDKMACLFNDGNYVIVNEAKGGWDDNVWYSNRYGYGRTRAQLVKPKGKDISNNPAWTGALSRSNMLTNGYMGSRSIN